MRKNSVYNGEVVGFMVGRIFKGSMQVLSVEFTTQEDAETWCESMNDPNKQLIHFPIKLTSLKNMHVPEHRYD